MIVETAVVTGDPPDGRFMGPPLLIRHLTA